MHQLFIDLKKIYDSVRPEVLYNILIELGVLMKLVRLIKLRLNKTYSGFFLDKHLSNMFSIMDGLKREYTLTPLLSNFSFKYNIRGFRVTRMD
jgi:hypothetical protein